MNNNIHVYASLHFPNYICLALLNDQGFILFHIIFLLFFFTRLCGNCKFLDMN